MKILIGLFFVMYVKMNFPDVGAMAKGELAKANPLNTPFAGQ